MIQANTLRVGNEFEYLIEDNIGGNEWVRNCIDVDDIAQALEGNEFFNKYYRPIPITLDTLARCNPPQMNQIAPLLEIGHGGQDKDPKQFTLTVKHTGRKIHSIHELQNFYEANMGEELVYLDR